MLSGPSVSEDVDREIRAHLALRAQELIDEGWAASAARDEATRLFGDRAAVARACTQITKSHDRAVGRARMMENVWQDIRFGARALLRSPGFAVVSVLTLALGIGANTAIFSVVNGVLLQPLPFERPDEIVFIREATNRGGSMSVAWQNFRDWRAQSSSFRQLAAYGAGATTVLGGEEPVQARVANVTQDFWSLFGVTPLTGRLTVAEDHLEDSEPVWVVSRGFWQNQLAGGDLSDLVLEVQGNRARVVGVVDNDFGFPGEADAWGALEQIAQSDSRTAHNWRVVGRLAAGVALEQAFEELDALTKVLVRTEAGADPDFLATGAVVVPLHEEVIGDARTPLWLLLGAAGLVLLVACTNLASTLLARGTGRGRELAVRLSLGAAKGRIVRQLLTESLVIAAIGGVAGVAMAAMVMRALRAFGQQSIPRLAEVTIDGWVLSYSAGIALATAFLFGLLPALRLTAPDAGDALRSGSRGNALEGKAGVWRLLVGTEVALALVLLVGAGLLVRSFQELLGEDVGADVTDVTTAAISLSLVKYESEYDHARWYDEFNAALSALPGVRAAGVISALPVSSVPTGRLELDGDVERATVAGYVVASGGAFEALDIPLLRGRLFDDRDGRDVEHVAIVSRSFAERTWPDQEPIGRTVNGGGMDNFWQERTFARVVGVVGDVNFRDLDDGTLPVVYFPHSQRPFRTQFGASVVVESAQGDAAALTAAVRSTLRRLDSDVPIRIRTLQSEVMESVDSRRFVLLLLGAFSVIALILAGVGIYGVVSYSVARRKREMGIRLALGARAGSVLGMVVKASMQMVVGGLFLGVLVSLGLTRVMAGLLYGVTPTDPLTITAVVMILAGTGFLASWLPAWAGTRVDPMITMRAE